MAKTVRVRVAVAVDRDGNWTAWGAKWAEDEEMITEAANDLQVRPPFVRAFFLTADLPLPTEPEVAASVEGDA